MAKRERDHQVPTNVERPIGDLLREFRLRSGMTQDELADASGVSARTISDLERGVRGAPQASSARLLADALRLEPDDRDLLFRRISQRRTVGRPRTPAAWAHDAPPILGRSAEVAHVLSLISRGERCITLIGPGGVGKTRLAREVTLRLGEGRVVWVGLDVITSTYEVMSALLRACGVVDVQADRRRHQQLVDALANRSITLVLDNVEHVIGAASDIAAALEDLPLLRVVVTSREAMRIRHEVLVPVAPLPLPASEASDEDLLANPAVALFLRTRAGYAPQTEIIPREVATVVRLLDGLPLAVELAAAQAVTVPPMAIAAMMEDSGLAVLAQGRRDGTARFETMDHAIGWSIDLLPATARRLLTILGAFVGGFTPEAVSEVARRIHAPEVLSGLPALINASLVASHPDTPGRLTMLEPIRLYAADRLRQSEEHDQVMAAHAQTYLQFAAAQERVLAGGNPLPALVAIEADYPNLHRAVIYAGQHGRTTAINTICDLHRFYDCRGYIAEARREISISLAETDLATLPPEIRGKAIFWAGYFAYRQDDFAECGEAVRQLRKIAAAADDPISAARADMLEWMRDGMVASAKVPRDAVLRRGLAQLPPDAPRHLRWSLTLLLGSELQEQGATAEALPLLEEAALSARDAGSLLDQQVPLTRIGLALIDLERPDEGVPLLLEALDIAQRLRLDGLAIMPLLGLAKCLARTSETRVDALRLAHLARKMAAGQGLGLGEYWDDLVSPDAVERPLLDLAEAVRIARSSVRNTHPTADSGLEMDIVTS